MRHRTHLAVAAALLVLGACAFKARESHEKDEHATVSIDSSGHETTFESKTKEIHEKVEVKPSKRRKVKETFAPLPDGGTYLVGRDTTDTEREGATKSRESSEASDAGTGKATGFHLDAGQGASDHGESSLSGVLGVDPETLTIGIAVAVAVGVIILALAVAFFIRKKA